MNVPPPNSNEVIETLDRQVREALLDASSPPFLGLLDFSDDQRTVARDTLRHLCNGVASNALPVLNANRYFAVWYVCDFIRRHYGEEGTAKVWGFIADAFGVQAPLDIEFQKSLYTIIKSKCEDLGLPVPRSRNVDLFKLHAGVSDAQLKPLIQAFFAQERNFGSPPLDDGIALNTWEDSSLYFVEESIQTLRHSIIWDVSAWHAKAFAMCRNGEITSSSTFHKQFLAQFNEEESQQQSRRPSADQQPQPKLVLDNMEIALELPAGTSRQSVQFDDGPVNHMRPGTVFPLPRPLPTTLSFRSGLNRISLLPSTGCALVGDADLGGSLKPVMSQSELRMSRVILFAREPVSDDGNNGIDAYQVGEGMYMAVFSLPPTGQLELKIGESPLRLVKECIRGISLNDGIIGRGAYQHLYSKETKLQVNTGIPRSASRDVTIKLGNAREKLIQFQSDDEGHAEVSLATILSDAEYTNVVNPVVLRIELMNPRQSADEKPVGSGIRLRAFIWPSFNQLNDAHILCSEMPENLVIDECQYITVNDRGAPCIDREAISDPEIVFEIEGKHQKFRLPPPYISLSHILPNGTSQPLPRESSITLTTKAKGGAIRVRCRNPDTTLVVPGHPEYQPFRGGAACTIGLRRLDSGWIRLRHPNGIPIDLVELQKEFEYQSVKIQRIAGKLNVRLSVSGEFKAVMTKFEIELETESERNQSGEAHFEIGGATEAPPKWLTAERQHDRSLVININEQMLGPGTWFGQIYVKDETSWRPVVSQSGETVTVMVSQGSNPSDDVKPAERTERVLKWSAQRHATESWHEGGVKKVLNERMTSLIGALDSAPGGRARILRFSLSNHGFDSTFGWIPPMYTLIVCPEIFEGRPTDFLNAGDLFEIMIEFGRDRLQDIERLDDRALVAFSNFFESEKSGERLHGFSIEKLMSIISTQECSVEPRWFETSMLGPSHWRAAHECLHDRICDTDFIDTDSESQYHRRSIMLRKLHGSFRHTGENLPVPSFIEDDFKDFHISSSKLLREFALAARSKRTSEWLNQVIEQCEFSAERALRALGDQISLAPELFSFHLLVAELETMDQ